MTTLRQMAEQGLNEFGAVMVAGRLSHGDSSHASHGLITHSYAALAFYTRGSVRLEHEGLWNVGEGDVLLLPAGAPHRMIETHGAQCWGVALCVPCLNAGGDARLLSPFEAVRDGRSAVVTVPARRHAFLETLFHELEDTSRRAYPDESLQVVQKSLLSLIINEVSQSLLLQGQQEPLSPRRQSALVVESLRFIEQNCLSSLTPRDVADAMGRSAAHLTSVLSKATGKSAGEWITAGRMAEARRLLSSSDERVETVAFRVGYADVTHFIRIFRREHGRTPSAWRRARRHGRGSFPVTS